MLIAFTVRSQCEGVLLASLHCYLPSLLSFFLCFPGLLAFGVRESTFFNNIFTGVNLLVVLYVIICGLFKADLSNWDIPSDKVKYCFFIVPSLFHLVCVRGIKN